MKEKIVHIAKNHLEAKAWEIQQYRSLSPDERYGILKELQRRFYGEKIPDIRKGKVVRCFLRDSQKT